MIVFRQDMTDHRDQLELWKTYQEHWVNEHKSSIQPFQLRKMSGWMLGFGFIETLI